MDTNVLGSCDTSVASTSASTTFSKNPDMSVTSEGDDGKRNKKLELNRIASRESRKRKKRRLEELQRSVLFLTHENHQLREQNELLRQMLVGRLPGQQNAGQVQSDMLVNQAAMQQGGPDLNLLKALQGTPGLIQHTLLQQS